MNSFETSQSLVPSANYRSMGTKLLLVCVLALVMAIPAFFVGGLVSERSHGTADTVPQSTALPATPQLLIYLLLRLEQDALLIGATSSFLAVAAVMYFTRHIDWYNPLSELTQPAKNTAAL